MRLVGSFIEPASPSTIPSIKRVRVLLPHGVTRVEDDLLA